MAQHYQVRPGDTAAGIALRLAGSAARWPELSRVNPHRNWSRIVAGELLVLPPGWTRPTTSTAPTIGDVAAGEGMTLDEARRRTPWLSPRFMPELVTICDKYGIPPFDMLAVLYQESGVHPSANPNPRTNANGLIHWMPDTAPRGTSHAELVRMSAEAQLVLVDDWLRTWAKKIGPGRKFETAGMVYATVFCPGRLSPMCDENTIAFRKVTECTGSALRSDPYCANSALDVLEPHGVITFADLTETIRRRMREPSFEKFAVRMRHEGGRKPPGRALALGAGLVTIAGLAAGAAYAVARYT